MWQILKSKYEQGEYKNEKTHCVDGVAYWFTGLMTVSGFLFFGEFVKGQTQQPKDFFGDLNNKSRLANPNDDASIDALVNEIFNFMLVDLSEVPSQIKGRIARTEKKYRHNQRNGISEVKVVEALNGLVIRFNAPEYSKTNETEVKDLRISMMPHLSQLVGAFRPSELNSNNLVNQTINPNMSPTEAVVIMLMLLQQKETNPFYQLTATEKSAMWQQLHSKEGIPQLPDNDDRIQEMKQLSNNIGNLSDTEKVNLANRALDILGMEQ